MWLVDRRLECVNVGSFLVIYYGCSFLISLLIEKIGSGEHDDRKNTDVQPPDTLAAHKTPQIWENMKNEYSRL